MKTIVLDAGRGYLHIQNFTNNAGIMDEDCHGCYWIGLDYYPRRLAITGHVMEGNY